MFDVIVCLYTDGWPYRRATLPMGDLTDGWPCRRAILPTGNLGLVQQINPVTPQRDNCIKYDLTQFDVGDGEKTERTSAYLEVTILFCGRGVRREWIPCVKLFSFWWPII